ncbi:MAG: site-2 protease family protein [Candidatus Diapherotrites archaeon]|nr:site-2 protease family protein [Candidatus Diapherotrites archaeon]
MDSLEAMHIITSVITISLAFSVGALYIGINSFIASFPIVLLTLGTGFVLHELSHRFVAKKFGCWAAYRAWLPGLALAVGLAVMTGGRFVFAAPGAVYIGGKPLTVKENGIISLAGPLANIATAIFFLLIANSPNTIIRTIGYTGAYINFFLAFFNMLPFPPLDGSKVLQWNTIAWLVPIAIAGFFVYMV